MNKSSKYDFSPYVSPENTEKLLWNYGFVNKQEVKRAYLIALKIAYYKDICKAIKGK